MLAFGWISSQCPSLDVSEEAVNTGYLVLNSELLVGEDSKYL